jgi:hypothetical protein
VQGQICRLNSGSGGSNRLLVDIFGFFLQILDDGVKNSVFECFQTQGFRLQRSIWSQNHPEKLSKRCQFPVDLVELGIQTISGVRSFRLGACVVSERELTADQFHAGEPSGPIPAPVGVYCQRQLRNGSSGVSLDMSSKTFPRFRGDFQFNLLVLGDFYSSNAAGQFAPVPGRGRGSRA